MGRTIRSHLPGAVFHLTARTQGHEPWFSEELRSRIVEYIASAIGTTDSRLLAYAIMPNHLHLVVRQGQSPLGHIMQPLLCRVALLVKRRHRIQGHVFERRFRDHACLDPDYVRNAIVYAHLNPVRAGLVDQAIAYRWSSHAQYVAAAVEPTCITGALAFEDALGLFASQEGAALPELRQAYCRYLAWRIERDRHNAAEELGETVGLPPSPPPVGSGDIWWYRMFARMPRSAGGLSERAEDRSPPSRLDLSDIAKQALAEFAPAVSLERVRGNSKARGVTRLRRIMVTRMNAAEYPGRAIARYLRVSDQCVSNILAAYRQSVGR